MKGKRKYCPMGVWKGTRGKKSARGTFLIGSSDPLKSALDSFKTSEWVKGGAGGRTG